MKKEKFRIEVSHIKKSFKLNKSLGVRQKIFKPFMSDNEMLDVIKDISFRVSTGKTLGLSGPNGSGKSTMLRLMAGILKPDSGYIKVHGSVAPVIELGSGLHPELSGIDNIYLYASILGVERSHLNDYLKKIISFSGLSKFIDVPLKKYSSGMKARLAFSVAAFSNADILLMDEVFAVGDLLFKERSMKLLKQLKKHKTIVLASHDIGLMQAVCDKIIVIEDGKNISEKVEVEIEFIKQMPIGSEFKSQATSNSMYPTIKIGDTICFRRIRFEKLNRGDIVAFYLKNLPMIVVHRIEDILVTKNGRLCITKGDNSISLDRWEIDKTNFLGRATEVEKRKIL